MVLGRWHSLLAYTAGHTELRKMRRKSICLLLGAGASCVYGYPLGEQLRDRILHLAPTLVATDERFSSHWQREAAAEAFEEFKHQFRLSHLDSIDAFLSRRAEYAELGKRCIAAVLIACEQEQTLFGANNSVDWYRYLWNRLSVSEWEDLPLRNLSIVTFNYDRSLEHYLLKAMTATYGVSEESAREKLRELRVVHVYGSLGALYPGDKGYYPYNNKLTFERIAAAAAELQVVPEGRSQSPPLIRSRDLLQDADQIAILGFGFDETNVSRLAEEGACHPASPVHPSAVSNHRVIGTCLGMTPAERASAYQRLTKTKMIGGKQPSGQLYDLDCRAFLRETLVLRNA